MRMACTGNFIPLVARSYMHEVPHYIILIRNSCFVNLKIERLRRFQCLKVKPKIKAFGGGG